MTERPLILPSRDDVANLKIGDLAPDCWGRMAEVVEIAARKEDVSGKLFVLYYTRTGPTSRCSTSMKEDELIRHAGLLQSSAELAAIERRMRAERVGA